MENRVARALLCAVFLVAGCGRSEGPTTLQKAYEALPRTSLCSQNLPGDWVSTWPLPTDKVGTFKVLFYALDRTAVDAGGVPRMRVTQPRGEALFSVDGTVATCSSKPVDLQPLEGERYGKDAMTLDEEEFDKESRALLQLTEDVGQAYARKTAADKKVLAAFWAQFKKMAEPPLRLAYYDAAPDFWDWLRRENGQSLLKPPH